jgi:hypothetical protein
VPPYGEMIRPPKTTLATNHALTTSNR